MNTTIFANFATLKKEGFKGFHTIKDLRNNKVRPPATPGVYLVLYRDLRTPSFLKKNDAGYGKDGSEAVAVLEKRWVQESPVIYIGKTGGNNLQATLESRIGQLLSFGSGLTDNHWGGRYIWQLTCHEELIVCWKIVNEEEPMDKKNELLESFRNAYGKNPFANIKG